VTYFLNFVKILCDVLTVAIILRVIMSWIAPGASHRLAVVLFQITEPLLGPLRRIIPRVAMLDFTPMVAIILLQLISYLLP
jgi:YggT family protein